MTSWARGYLSIHPEVEQALSDGKPVVALESTVITHGLPFPQNQHLAKDMERVIRDGHAIPATIAILDGMLHVGLDEIQLERLAHGEVMAKVSVRDIAPAVTKRVSGGTTVAGSLAIAQMVGIKVFATGA